MKCIIKQTCKGYITWFYVFLELLKAIPDFLFNTKMDKPFFCRCSCGLSLIALEICLFVFVLPKNPSTINLIELFVCWIGIPLFMVPLYGAVFDCTVPETLKEGV